MKDHDNSFVIAHTAITIHVMAKNVFKKDILDKWGLGMIDNNQIISQSHLKHLPHCIQNPA